MSKNWVSVYGYPDRAIDGRPCVLISSNSNHSDDPIHIESALWLGLDAARKLRDQIYKAIHEAESGTADEGSTT
jgi:hypothetical protein